MTSGDSSTTLAPRTALTALDQRFREAATLLLDPMPELPRTEHPGAVASVLLPAGAPKPSG
jgi:hypothetical protein